MLGGAGKALTGPALLQGLAFRAWSPGPCASTPTQMLMRAVQWAPGFPRSHPDPGGHLLGCHPGVKEMRESGSWHCPLTHCPTLTHAGKATQHWLRMPSGLHGFQALGVQVSWPQRSLPCPGSGVRHGPCLWPGDKQGAKAWSGSSLVIQGPTESGKGGRSFQGLSERVRSCRAQEGVGSPPRKPYRELKMRLSGLQGRPAGPGPHGD